MHTIPLSALRWGLSSLPPLSSSYTKPSVLEWNGSLPLIDSIYCCPWNALVVPKGCHFSISIPYNFISIWQLLTVSQVGERKGTETHLWNRKISCKMVGGCGGFNWQPVPKVSSCKLNWQKDFHFKKQQWITIDLEVGRYFASNTKSSQNLFSTPCRTQPGHPWTCLSLRRQGGLFQPWDNRQLSNDWEKDNKIPTVR